MSVQQQQQQQQGTTTTSMIGSSDSNNNSISSQQQQQSSQQQQQQQSSQQQPHQQQQSNNNYYRPTTTTTTTTTTTNNNNTTTNPNYWVSASWMPHASLSQTSHVALSIRAAFVLASSSLSSSIGGLGMGEEEHHYPVNVNNKNVVNDCWQCHVKIRGNAGLALLPVHSSTTSAPVLPVHENHAAVDFPSVSDATQVCRWDKNNDETTNTANNKKGDNSSSMMQIPIRWRDLPRDAYLEFTVTGYRGSSKSNEQQGHHQVYDTATFSLFDTYGKLRSGLQKIPLVSPHHHHHNNNNRNTTNHHTTTTNINPGLVARTNHTTSSRSSSPRSSSSSWQHYDDDPVWKASKIIEQLNRFEDEQQYHNNNTNTNNNTTSTTNSTTTRSNGGSNFGDIPSVPWLDQMAREYCAQTFAAEATATATPGGGSRRRCRRRSTAEMMPRTVNHATTTACRSPPPSAYLIIEIPFFDQSNIPIIHEETFYPKQLIQGPSGSITPLDMALYQRQKYQQQQQQQQQKQHQKQAGEEKSQTLLDLEPPPFHPFNTIPFLDYENQNDNPIDDKYRTLAHDLLRGLVDPALKPDRRQRDQLASIIASPSYHPTREEKDLLWKFRFSLVDNRRALTKFLLAVEWTVESEVVQAAELLEQWRKRSPIEVTDALKLLGKQFGGTNLELVRAYAIDTLESAPDEELHLYLLQLVQALKFETSLQQQQQETTTTSSSSSTSATTTTTKNTQSLATFLIMRASNNVLLANYLYWYLKVELQDPAHGAKYREIFDDFQHILSRTPFPESMEQQPSTSSVSLLSSSSSSNHSNRSEGTNNSNSSSSCQRRTSSSSSTSIGASYLFESVSKLGDKLLGTDLLSSKPTELFDNMKTSGQQQSSSKNKKNHQNTTTTRSSSSSNTRSVWDVLKDQDTFISGIMDVQMSYYSKSKQTAKEAHLRSVLKKEGYGVQQQHVGSPTTRSSNNPSSSSSSSSRRLFFPMPCAPEIMVNGVIPEKAKVFRSAVYPALIEFNVEHVVDKNCFTTTATTTNTCKQSPSGIRRYSGGGGGNRRVSNPATTTGTPTTTGRKSSSSSSIPTTTTTITQLKRYRVLMKTGDDLRQDQLVMMMIKLMDRLLKRASLDLCITPYSIIATSPSSGIVEFVEHSVPLSAILANHQNSILQFFQSCAPQKGTKYGVRSDVISSYVRSVAGGCVLTYILGVGDRHLDNLMITKTGRFFHIDFGFMFGRDPKPLPPAFRLTREMVEGMGGSESAEYRQFCSLACQAFNALRKSAGLVLNLLHLMSDAGIEDLSNNPSAVIAKVEERFRLDLTDEQAERFFLTLINDSLSAYAPRFMDIMHSIAVARR